MMWFKRGLEMLDIAFERSLKDPKEEICDSFTAAYEVTLRPNHGMLIRPIFSVSDFPPPPPFSCTLGLPADS